MFRAIQLPTTSRQDLTSRFYLKKPLFVACPIARPQRPEIGRERLRVTALENPVRNESLRL
jgi:hypothetical protein